MRKNFIILILLIVSVSIVFCEKRTIYIKSYYNDKNTNKSNRDDLSEKLESDKEKLNVSVSNGTKTNKGGVIKVGFAIELPPYSYRTKEGEIKGFDVDVISAVLDEMGFTYTIEILNWAKALSDLQIGEIDILPMMNITEERTGIYNFTDSYADTEEVIFVHESHDHVKGSTEKEVIKKLYGMKVSVQSSSATHELLRKHKEIIIITEQSEVASLRNLSLKKTEAVPIDKLSGFYYKNMLNLPIKMSATIRKIPYYTGVRKEIDKKFIENFNEALKKIKENGTFEKIQNRWF